MNLKSLNCKGTLIDLSKPKVMGIINTTPDSFYDGSTPKDLNSVLTRVENMIEAGASFIDIGGYSSRPNADDVSEEEEIKRVVPYIEAILKAFPETLISIDTYRSKVADLAIQAGAALVNDISGGQLDEKMFDVVAQHQVPYIMMHMRGTPRTMQNPENLEYKNFILDLYYYFTELLFKAREKGINDCIIDLGFGFSKTREQNFELLSKMDYFQNLDVPILTGISRKSMIYRSLKIEAKEALNGTTFLHAKALENGSNILRVHDVKEALECIKLYEELRVYK